MLIQSILDIQNDKFYKNWPVKVGYPTLCLLSAHCLYVWWPQLLKYIHIAKNVNVTLINSNLFLLYFLYLCQ